jgi:hypothetical protein
MYKNSIHVLQRTNFLTTTKTSWLMMFILIGTYYENRMRHVLLNIALKAKIFKIIISHSVCKLHYCKKIVNGVIKCNTLMTLELLSL